MKDLKVTCDRSNYNFIGDITGNYKTLMALLDKMPQDATPFSVGDMHDRGPMSKEVLYFFYKNKYPVVMGNHETLMVDWVRSNGIGYIYNFEVWGGFTNGAYSTLQSFGLDYLCHDELHTRHDAARRFKKDHPELLAWLERLPTYYETDEFIVTHAPINPTKNLEGPLLDWEAVANHDDPQLNFLWNIGKTRRRAKFQIHGHVAHRRALWLTDKTGDYGVNLDSSRGDVMTGMHWPSKVLYTQEYLDDPQINPPKRRPLWD